MGIEEASGSGRGTRNNESRKGKRRQKQQRPPRELSPLQKLYHTCEEVFADCGPGIVPSPENIQRLAALLDGITHEDVGIRPNMRYFCEWAPMVSYIKVHECDKFMIAIFCFPPNIAIPLHNHPGMTVFSKLLFGTVHVKAYDWANEMNTDSSILENANAPKCQPEGLRLAKLKVDADITGRSLTSILYPADGGNVHCIIAKTACAMLDVLSPPYNEQREGGHCQYYQEFPFASCPVEGQSEGVGEVNNGFVWLKEMEMPSDFLLYSYPYKGPKIRTTE